MKENELKEFIKWRKEIVCFRQTILKMAVVSSGGWKQRGSPWLVVSESTVWDAWETGPATCPLFRQERREHQSQEKKGVFVYR